MNSDVKITSFSLRFVRYVHLQEYLGCNLADSQVDCKVVDPCSVEHSLVMWSRCTGYCSIPDVVECSGRSEDL